MNIRVREAHQEELASIIELWEQFMTVETDAVPDADLNNARENWASRLSLQIQRKHFAVAEQELTIVGFIGAIDHSYRSWVPERILYITDVYVHPECRRSNATRMLLETLQAQAKELGYTELWTNTHRNNRRVQVLLQHKGFLNLDGFEIQGLEDQLYYRKPV